MSYKAVVVCKRRKLGLGKSIHLLVHDLSTVAGHIKRLLVGKDDGTPKVVVVFAKGRISEGQSGIDAVAENRPLRPSSRRRLD